MSDLAWFDQSQHEPTQVGEYDPLPSGKYRCVIIESETVDTKAGDGKRLKLKIEVIDGPHRGRKIFDGLNIINPSAKAQQIARGQLSAICRAVNVLSPRDSSELHNKPIVVVLGTRPSNIDGSPENTVKGYEPAVGATAPPPKPVPGPPAKDEDIPF